MDAISSLAVSVRLKYHISIARYQLDSRGLSSRARNGSRPLERLLAMRVALLQIHLSISVRHAYESIEARIRGPTGVQCCHWRLCNDPVHAYNGCVLLPMPVLEEESGRLQPEARQRGDCSRAGESAHS